MRLVHRLSQYQRLYQQLGNAPVAVTIGELAAMFYCSERHARTLVQQLQDQGLAELAFAARPRQTRPPALPENPG